MGRYIDTSLCMSQDQQNHWLIIHGKVWRSIYNNHIDFKISLTMIWVHREQAMLVSAQGHLYEGTRQNMLVTKHNNVD